MKEYIEREAIIPALEDYYEPINPNFSMTLELGQISEVLQNMPAADVAPVRHGKLNFVQEDMPYCNYGVCDVCGAYVQAWNYCPNCGALMDGKEDEHEVR